MRIIGSFRSDVLNSPVPIATKEIEAEAVGCRIDLVAESLSKRRPLSRIHEAFEHGLLNTLAVIATVFCYAPESSLSFRRFRAYVIGN